MAFSHNENYVEPPLAPELEENRAIKLIGLGGVGAIVARYLAVFLASLNQPLRMVFIDGDNYEPLNRSRMLYTTPGNKAAVICAELLTHFADSLLAMAAIQEYVSRTNIERLIHNRDIVILAVDNHATRKLVSDFCSLRLDHVCLISGGNDGIALDSSHQATRGTYGNCQIYIRSDGRNLSQEITKYHPEIRNPVDQNPSEASCTEMLQSVPQILFTNLAAASAILNAFWLYCCKALHYSELAFDIADGLMRPVLPLSVSPSS